MKLISKEDEEKDKEKGKTKLWQSHAPPSSFYISLVEIFKDLSLLF